MSIASCLCPRYACAHTQKQCRGRLCPIDLGTNLTLTMNLRCSVLSVHLLLQNYKNLAYKDQPIKEDNVHISAPHIYGSVLEAFELRKGAGLSVLHAGSGTGYMTCIMASILGPHSVHYCVEIHQDVMEHAKQAIGLWKETCSPAQKNENVNLIHGNALELDTAKGECVLGFDRIYIGAAVTKRNLPMFKSMLKPGGILVGPGKVDLTLTAYDGALLHFFVLIHCVIFLLPQWKTNSSK